MLLLSSWSFVANLFVEALLRLRSSNSKRTRTHTHTHNSPQRKLNLTICIFLCYIELDERQLDSMMDMDDTYAMIRDGISTPSMNDGLPARTEADNANLRSPTIFLDRSDVRGAAAKRDPRTTYNRSSRPKVVRKYSGSNSNMGAMKPNYAVRKNEQLLADMNEPIRAGEIVKILQRIAERKGIALANKTLRFGISRRSVPTSDEPNDNSHRSNVDFAVSNDSE